MNSFSLIAAPVIYLAASLLPPLLPKRSAWLPAFAATAAAFVYSILNILQTGNGAILHYAFGGWPRPVGIEFTLDALSAFVVTVVNGIGLLVMTGANTSLLAEMPDKRPGWFSAALLMLAGFNGMVMTGDFFNLYVFLEIASLSGYALIAAGNRKAPFSAFRYLMMGTIGGTFYLFGVGLLYFKTGSLNMKDVAEILPQMMNSEAVLAAAVLMITGMSVKTAIFPMHGWLPDAYTNATSISTALIAPVGTKIGAYVIFRLVFFTFGLSFLEYELPVAETIAWLSAAGIIYGSIMAIAQKEIKRMLAYSSVAQIAYIGLGIGMATPMAAIGALLHLLNHALMKMTLFLVTAGLRYRTGSSMITDLQATLRSKMPVTVTAFTLAAISMIGLPPFAGFFSKWYLALGTIESENTIFLAVILISSLLNAVYFFRIIEKLWLRSPPEEDAKTTVHEAPVSLALPAITGGLLLIIAGVLNVVIVNEFLEPVTEMIGGFK